MSEVEKTVDTKVQMNNDAEVVAEQENATVVEPKTKAKKEKKEKKEKKPRAKTAYNYFVSTTMKELAKEKEFEGKKNSELMKECGVRWKDKNTDRSPYEKMVEEQKSS